MYIHLLIDCHFCCTNFRGRDNRPPLFPSGYVPTSWEMLEYIDKSPTPFIYGYNYKTIEVPKIPLIPPPLRPS